MYYQEIGNLSICVVSVGAEAVSIEPGIYIKLQWLSKTLLTINPGPRFRAVANGPVGPAMAGPIIEPVI